MKLIKRIGYYLIGFSIGLVILAFIFNQKKTSCSYGPQARAIKNITTKRIVFSKAVHLESKTIDSLTLRKIIKNGVIDFSKSETQKKPCGIYHIESNFEKKDWLLTVENCDSIATVLKLERR